MNSFSIRHIIKRTFEWLGYTCRATRALPSGYDLFLDLHRLGIDRCEVIFDVGAHVGTMVTRFLAVYPMANIYSFEPSPETFRTLLLNCTSSNIHAFNVAVGSKSSSVIIYASKDSVLNSLVPQLNVPREDAKPIEIAVVTLDEFCSSRELQRIDLLKIDTEGYDLEVLMGARTLLEENRVRVIYAECSMQKSYRHVGISELIEFLSPYGFSLRGIYDQSYWEGGGYCNALFAVVRN